MEETDEQIILARIGAFDEGAGQMEEQARIAKCTCEAPEVDYHIAMGTAGIPRTYTQVAHQLFCPVAVWGRAARILHMLKAADEMKGEKYWNKANAD